MHVPCRPLLITLTALLSACTTAPVRPTTPDTPETLTQLGTFNATFSNPLGGPVGARQLAASVALDPAAPTGAVRVRTAGTGTYDDERSNRRYLWGVFEVTNTSATTLTNLTMVAYSKANGSIGGTAITRLQDAQGRPYLNERVAQNIRPGDHLNVLSSYAFQGLAAAEAQRLENSAKASGTLAAGDDVLEYGFTVINPRDGSQVLRPGETGTLVLATKLPLLAGNAPQKFNMSLLLSTGGARRVTRNVGESNDSVALRARLSGAREIAYIGPDAATAPRGFTTVRLPNLRLTTGDHPTYLLDQEGPLSSCVQGVSPNSLRRLNAAGPLVTFLSDDGTAADHSRLLPLFRQKGVVATAAIESRNMLSGDPYFATPEQVRDLQRAGWEIASHTRTHPDLVTLSDADLDAEIQGSRQDLEEQGFTVNTFVYPYGSQNATVREKVCQTYRTAFIDRGGVNDTPLDTNYQIRRVAFGSWTDAGQNTMAAYRAAIDDAVARRGWLVFMLHPGNREQHDEQQQQYLAQTIDYLREQGVPIVTAADALARLGLR
ncbi:polysaccharide deacetylase family protein [Deinococcus maricopensis]|uniref:Polysaccharide deacetylase n=1 Tax=Deinococcus maricopensis (strain DSM 21211 / LMG 22137 / NRRL B-23946 / LB-34) TaxID=709986 RepID=E8U373_DEIML|nr:polysaccharide deacetylase family protein [Deinococcus maricopensis]ADV66018.1 polysaccharide deacetylase [Deinococcus maricopensis DSM 21211]